MAAEKPARGEGDRLQALLDEAGKKKSDLARAVGKTPQAISDWIKAQQWSGNVWEEVQRGVLALGLDPTKLRKVAATMQRQRTTEDYRQLLAGFSSGQLEKLLNILEVSRDEHERRIVKILVEDRIAGASKHH